MSESYEEEFQGDTIYVEISADRYNPAYSWSICKDDIEYDTGLSFSKDDAISDAEAAITQHISR